MKNTINSSSPKLYAKYAGLFYLVIAIIGGLSIGYVPSVIIVPEDASATAQNILDNRGLFLLGIIGDIAVFLAEIVLTILLYQLFKSVSQSFALIALFSRLGMSMVMGVNLLNYMIPFQLLTDPSYLAVFGADQLQALALLFLDAHQYGIYVWGIFFGLHLAALGYLIFKSSYVPHFLGILMMVGSIGYAIEGLAKVFAPQSELLSIIVTGLLVIAVIGELTFTFWLLIKGVKKV